MSLQGVLFLIPARRPSRSVSPWNRPPLLLLSPVGTYSAFASPRFRHDPLISHGRRRRRHRRSRSRRRARLHSRSRSPSARDDHRPDRCRYPSRYDRQFSLSASSRSPPRVHRTVRFRCETENQGPILAEHDPLAAWCPGSEDDEEDLWARAVAVREPVPIPKAAEASTESIRVSTTAAVPRSSSQQPK